MPIVFPGGFPYKTKRKLWENRYALSNPELREMMEDPEFVKCTIKEGDLKILNKAARERGLRLRPKTGRSARASATAKSS